MSTEAILQKISRVNEILKILKELKPDCSVKFNNDAIFRGALLHYLYLMADSCISLGEMVVKAQDLRKPQSYHDTIDILGESGILEPEFAYEFAGIAGFRNFLAHDYDKIDKEIICNSLKKYLRDVDRFLEQISDAA